MARFVIPKHVDLELIYRTQPRGNIRFLDSMIKTGNACMASLYITKFPSEPEGLWQSLLHNIPNSFVMSDLANQEDGEALMKIRKAIREQFDRWQHEKEVYDAMIAREEYEDLAYLGRALGRSQEVMKYFTVRVILYADTKEQLEKRIVETRKYLEKHQFECTVLMMEQKEEYLSMFLDHHAQTYLPNCRVGRDVSSSHVGTTFPANHVFLHDDRGTHIGYSITNGNILFDPFELDDTYRKHYNLLILGEMGSGKSTLLKKLMMNWGIKGYVLRGFDKSGEYTDIIRLLKGKIATLDGSNGAINLFQVFPTVVDPDTQEIDEKASFLQHKSKLATWYSIVKPTVEQSELDLFELALNDLYQEFGFKVEGDEQQYTSRHNHEYPLLEDLIQVLYRQLDNLDNSVFKQQKLEEISLTLLKLKENYGMLFNQYTTIENVMEERILFFNIDGLMALDNKPIIDAQMFNALSLCWAALINKGKKQAQLYQDRMISFDDVCRAMLIIDECHNQLNIQNLRQVKFVNTMQREGRKLFLGVTLATQSLSSLAPEVMSTEASELLRDIYNFSQYKFFFKIAPANIDHLKRLAQQDITDGQVERIATFQRGHALLNMTGGANIEFTVDVSSEELDLFKGGGRNAEDQ